MKIRNFVTLIVLFFFLNTSAVFAVEKAKPGSLGNMIPKYPDQKQEITNVYYSYVKSLANSENLAHYCDIVSQFGSQKNTTQKIFIGHIRSYIGSELEGQVFEGLKNSAMENFQECEVAEIEIRKKYTAILTTTCYNSIRLKREYGEWKIFPDTIPFYLKAAF